MENKRYRIVEGSQSAHCCFEWTIVDTHKTSGDHHDCKFEQVCESFDLDNAVLVCDALNAYYLKSKDEKR